MACTETGTGAGGRTGDGVMLDWRNDYDGRAVARDNEGGYTYRISLMSKPTSAGVWSLERTRNDVPQNARPTNSGVFASEAAAMTKASIMARHTRQLRTLARTDFPLPGRHPTKWGLAQTSSEEHTSELQSLMRKSYAVFCLKK